MEPERIGPLIDRYAAPLELYARQWTDAPEDAVQEAFVRLAGLEPGPSSPPAWLFRAVRNGAINAGIARRRRARREAEAGAWFVANRADPGEDPEFEVEPADAEAALRALPDDQREAIVAHLWGGLSFDQVARLTGRSSSSAHRSYHAGLAALRNRLGVPCPAKRPR